MAGVTPNQGLDDYIAEKLYRNGDLALVLYENAIGTLSATSVFADLVEPTGETGYSRYLFDTVAKRDGWGSASGVVTYNPQIRRDTSNDNVLTGGTSISGSVDWGTEFGGALLNETIVITLDTGATHTATISFVSGDTLSFTPGVPSQSNNQPYYVVNSNTDARVTWENTGGGDWTNPITGYALVDVTNSLLIHFEDVPAAKTMQAGEKFYVNFRSTTV